MYVKSLAHCLARNKLRVVPRPLAFAYAIPSARSILHFLFVWLTLLRGGA